MAYRAFYDAYFDRLLRYLFVVAKGDEEAAREALQLMLVRVVRHIKIFDDEEKFWSWLTVLARSAFADERKKFHRYFSFLERFTNFTRIQNDNASAIENQTDERLQNLLKQKIALLPPDEKQLIEQKYFARRAVREIAEESRMTEKAVESKLSRVRKKLKETVLNELKEELETAKHTKYCK